MTKLGLTPLQQAAWKHQIAELRNATLLIAAVTNIPSMILGFGIARIWFGV